MESTPFDLLGGRETTELLLQDHPTTGAVFANDQLTRKIRHPPTRARFSRRPYVVLQKPSGLTSFPEPPVPLIPEPEAHQPSKRRSLTASARSRWSDEHAALRREWQTWRLEDRCRDQPGAYFGRVLRHMRVHWPSEVLDEFETLLSPDAAEDLLRASLIVQGNPRLAAEPQRVWLVIATSFAVSGRDLDRAVQGARALRQAGLRALPGVASLRRATPTVERRARADGVALFRQGALAAWDEALAAWPAPSLT